MQKTRRGPPLGTKRTIRIDVQYDGTQYLGWQRQPKGDSIQGLLEKALTKVASEKVTLFGASRTDAGVHAMAQVASFSLSKSKTPVKAFVQGTNSLLPRDIRVCMAAEVDLHFLASADSVKKTYRYFVEPSENPTVFLKDYVWHIKWPLQFSLMNEAAEFLIGEHDFLAFQGSQADTKTSVRTVFQAKWVQGPFHLWHFEIMASGFLKYMVRNVVGTLVEVGLGKRDPGEIRKILEHRKRVLAGVKAPPQGLFLWKVDF